MTSWEADREKAWRYVGRFMWSFANVEAALDNIFEIMFNLNAVSFLLLQRLPLGQKVEVIRLGFKYQNTNHNKTLDRVRDLAAIRNAIAHSSFEPVPPFERSVNGVKIQYEGGIEFSYIDPHGRMQVPGPKKQGRNETQKEMDAQVQKEDVLPEDSRPDQSTITYTEFDNYDAHAKEVMGALIEIGGHCEPINEGINIVPDIAKIIAASENIVPFARPT